MTERTQSAKIIAQGGLKTSQNYLFLSDNAPGSATALTNFEPGLSGGYRRINGFAPLEPDFTTVNDTVAEGKILCVFIYKDEIYAARKLKSGSTYTFFRWDAGNEWKQQTTGLILNSIGVDRVRHAKFNFDGTDKIIFVDGKNNAVLFDGTSWKQIKDTNTGADYNNAGGDQAINAPKFVTVFKNHIFLAGDPNYPNVISHSAPNAEYDWTAASGAGQIAAGFPVNALHPWRDQNFVFGTNNIKYITVEGTDFTIKDVTSNIGCIASDSVQEIGGSLVFLSQDGIRPIAGTDRIGDVELETISKDIQNDILTLLNDFQDTEISSVVIRSKSQIRFFFSNSSVSTSNAKGIIGGLVGDADGINWSWSKLLGIRTCCCTSGYIGNSEYVLHGDFNGGVYRQEVGSTFNGSEIFALYKTPYLDFGDTEIRKTFRGVNVFIKPEGPLSLTTQLTYDWGLSGRRAPPVYVSEDNAEFSMYGESEYGEGLYGASSIPVRLQNVEGSAFSIQIAFTNTTSSCYTIQGIVFEFTTDGRI